jgi:hypothetical protein
MTQEVDLPVEPIVERARSYEEATHRNREIVSSLNAASQKRLVWFVAICGYVIFNGQSLWEILIGAPLTNSSLFWMAGPWTLTAVVAIAAHVLTEKLEHADSSYYIAKVSALQVLRLDLASGSSPNLSFDDILNDRGNLKDFATSASRWNRRVVGLERAAQCLLACAFVSTFVFSGLVSKPESPPPATQSDTIRYSWAFAQNMDNSLRPGELCRQSLAESLYYPANEPLVSRQGRSNIFVYSGAVETYRIHGFESQGDCEVALTGLTTRLGTQPR